MKNVKRNTILLVLLLVLITGCSKENGGEAIQTTAERLQRMRHPSLRRRVPLLHRKKHGKLF